MINESNLPELYRSAVAAFPNTTKRQHAIGPINITELNWTPFIGVKTLFLKGLAQSGRKEYNPIILFKNVNYQENEIIIADKLGVEHSLGRLSLDSDVLLRCGCDDFYWRFNFYNHLDRSLQGRVRAPYVSQGGPPANPYEMEGMCKHLIKLTQILQEANLLS